ncbi:hypothetical protein SVIOM342S_02743 [Streptomyces violaceorubidus]
MAAILIADVNLYALAIVVEALLGWPEWVAIVVAGFFVLAYITLGGLSSAIYNEVLQFFVILAGLIPITILGLKKVGGWDGLSDSLSKSHGSDFMTAWGGTGIGSENPLGANWLTIVLGLGFVLSFGYWTTNFAEVQRALSAKNLSAAQRTPADRRLPGTCVRAVDGAIPIPAAISRVSSPSATRTSTSTSRGVSICNSRCPSSSGCAAGFSSSPKAPCNNAGATAASPARAFMIARSTPSIRSSCRTYPDAPAANAAAMPRGLGTGPSTSTATCGRSRLIRTTGSKIPGSAGVAVPSRHTSGARLITSSAAPAAGAAAASTRCPRSFSAEASASASNR